MASGGASNSWLWDETQAIPIRGRSIYANGWLQQLSSLLIAAPMSILSMCMRPFSLASLAMTLLAGVGVPQASAQSFNVLYTFHGSDGAHPETGLTIDRGGTLYGTTVYGGSGGSTSSCAYQEGCGVIFQLVHRGSEWILNPLHRFTGGSDGSGPGGRVLFGPGGLLYGTATAGGARKGLCPQGCGTVFTLRPSGKACHNTFCPWTQTVLYEFQFTEGAEPSGDLAFDQGGNIYGTTVSGGINLCSGMGCGTVYELTHVKSRWSESMLYEFSSQVGPPGYWPLSGVILDNNGHVFGATSQTQESSSVFELTPFRAGWTETTLPLPPIPFSGSGSIVQYSRNGKGWTSTTVYKFPQAAFLNGPLTLDAAGNVYGVTTGRGYGSVFKLTHSKSGWTYTSLHDFSNGSDGAQSYGEVILDAHGNIYGTTFLGGDMTSCVNGCGVVWEITP
jgi:hypothetical protein